MTRYLTSRLPAEDEITITTSNKMVRCHKLGCILLQTIKQAREEAIAFRLIKRNQEIVGGACRRNKRMFSTVLSGFAIQLQWDHRLVTGSKFSE